MRFAASIAVALQLLTFSLAAPLATTESTDIEARQSSAWWMAGIKHQGTVAYGSQNGYQIFRNVKDMGAKGDGVSDDTAAINAAMSAGNRCGNGCDSTTLTPAIIYFPPGTYVVSKPIEAFYYTQLIGDATNLPTIKAAPGFQGIAIIDVDPYNNDGSNWFTNQNNFFRQIRNFVIDMTAMPQSAGAGIHWQVAQATSLQNIRFEMVRGGGKANKQQGIFMDNGSGGFMTDLVFNGGNYGAFFGNQQFTTRNMTFNGCNTAIFMNWNWLWAIKSVKVNNCGVGIDMSNSPQNQTVGSVLVQDSTFTNTPVGVKTSWTTNSAPVGGGTLIVDNCDFSGVAVQSNTGSTMLPGGHVSLYTQGRQYHGSSGSTASGAGNTAPSKPAVLLDNGKFFEKSKPQYEGVPASSFVSIKSKGAKGDGVTDDTQAVQAAINGLQAGQVLFFDHGAYVISNTVLINNNVNIVGEIWPLIMAKGSNFQDQNNPKPVFQVGNANQKLDVRISDIMFETVGPQPGAIMLQWNSAPATGNGNSGVWDTHFRIGGSAGTNLQSDKCAKNPKVTAGPNPDCIGAFLLFHVGKTASVYTENMWAWVSDHELDRSDHNQINIYNGRGIFIESTQPTWFYGTSAEHSQLFDYGLSGAQNVYMSAIQDETAYMQPNPDATVPFTVQSRYLDPTFEFCDPNDKACKKTWGLKIFGSSDIFVYGAGVYSFFDNYDQDCIAGNTCQTNKVHVQKSQNVHLYGLTTVGTKNMVAQDGKPQVTANDNRSNFGTTIAVWETS